MPDASDHTQLRVHVEVTDPANVPPAVQQAIEDLAAALADEEITVGEQLADALDEESEVSGFAMGSRLRLGDLDITGGPIIKGPIVMDFCVGHSDKGGGSCTIHGREDGDPPVDSCRIKWG